MQWTWWQTVTTQHKTLSVLHFLEIRFVYFDYDLTGACPSRSNWPYISMVSGNGLAPNRRQAITWAHDDPVHWQSYSFNFQHLPDVFKGMKLYIPKDVDNYTTLRRYVIAFDGDVVADFEKDEATHIVVKSKKVRRILTFKPKQNGCHVEHTIFLLTLLCENWCDLFKFYWILSQRSN